jgi:hypothetical protein
VCKPHQLLPQTIVFEDVFVFAISPYQIGPYAIEVTRGEVNGSILRALVIHVHSGTAAQGRAECREVAD